VVSSLCLLYGFSTLDAGSAIAAALSSTFQTPVAAYAFLVFVLLYVPCIAAVSTLYKEMNSLKWTARSILWQICAAWLVSFLVYQIGSLFF
jgi:ferrous iron transport protein B